MNAEHLQTKPIRVSGHLEESRGIFQMILNWRTSDGKRGRKSISTGLPVKGNKKRAEIMLSATCKEKELELANMPNASDLLFADFMEQWLNVIRKEVKLTTFGGYQLNVQKAIAPYFRERGILLRDLTGDDINDFYDEMLERIKATSVHKYHANISKALKYAVEKNLIQHSVMDRVKRPKAERFVGKFLKQSEVVDMFEAVKGHRLELGAILGAFYGLRRAEIVGLRWESINFEANTFTIEHTVTTTFVDGEYVIIADDTTKYKASYRTLPLVPAFREKLLAVKSEQERNRKLCGKSFNKAESCYIYTDPLGNRINPDYLTEAFPKFMERKGFKRIRFHDLRHTCASFLVQKKIQMKQVQEWMGHSDIGTTGNIYSHLDFDSKLESADAIGSIIRGEKNGAQGKEKSNEQNTRSDYSNILSL